MASGSFSGTSTADLVAPDHYTPGMKKPETFCAVDLLEKTLEFTSMTPDPEMWSYAAQRDNPPRFVRLQQLHALLAAFGLMDSVPAKTRQVQIEAALMPALKSLLDGTFESRSIAGGAELCQFADEYFEQTACDAALARVTPGASLCICANGAV